MIQKFHRNVDWIWFESSFRHKMLIRQRSYDLFFFVNDIVILYNREFTQKINQFQKKLFARYKMRYMSEIQWFFDMKTVCDRYHRLLYLYQNSYIDKLIVKFNIDINKKHPNSPLDENHCKNTNIATKQKIYVY